MSNVLTISLRGALHQAPENTVPAIKKAVAGDVDAIAIDVQGAKDDEPLVLADTRLDRTTNSTGRVNRMTAKEIRALDAGSWAGAEFAGTKVPTLAEALEAVGDTRLLLTIPELRAGSPLVDKIATALEARKKPEDDVLVFTDSESLKVLREKAPKFACALALDEKVEGWVILRKAEKLELKVVRPHRQQINSEFVRNAHAKGIKVLAHFADEEAAMRDLLGMKVDGIITGRPERLKRVLEEAEA